MTTAVLPERARVKMDEFLEMLTQGHGRLTAAIEMGWTPKQLAKWMTIEEFASIVRMAEDIKCESLEKVVYQKAESGNMEALKFYLMNRKPREWAERRQVSVEQQTTIDVSIVAATKEALVERLRQGGVAALQAGGPLDADIVEAEVVED